MSHTTPLAAYEHNGQPISQEGFYAIACDPRRSVAVEACAGAGKTWMLVSRMVRALLDGAAPHEILAITFTKKAAGEMRQRLQDWVQAFAHADDDSLRTALLQRGLTHAPQAAELAALRGLHSALLLQGRGVQVRTFHSWFAALLRSAPLAVLDAMGLPSSYELLEDDTQAIELVWQRFQNRLLHDEAGLQDYQQAVAAHGRHATHKALEAALHKRTEFVLADQHGVVDASVQAAAQVFAECAAYAQPLDAVLDARSAVHTQLWEAARALGASSLKTCTKAAQVLEMALSQGRVADVLEALFTEKGSGSPRKFSEKLEGLGHVRAAQESLERLIAAQSQHEAHAHQLRMTRLMRGLVQDYAALKREQGWVDMGDLERAALMLMSDPVLSGWVQERLDTRVRHLLIDEFQDTNPLQWQALSAWLSGYAGAGQAPSVFVVGDPKQSIYRFRRAEPQVFKAAQAFVVQALGGDVLSCDHTRRNAPEVIAVVNTVMGQAQEEGVLDGFRPHTTDAAAGGQLWQLPRIARNASDPAQDTDDALAQPLAPTLSSDVPPDVQAAAKEGLARAALASPDVAPQALWRDSLITPKRVLEETRKTQECRQAARWIAQQLAAPGSTLQPADIMVLARRRERLGLMQAELAALHIPALQPEKKELAEQPAVQDLMALLDVLVSTAHDLSLARVLKSPLFGWDDADLVLLAQQQRAAQSTERPCSWWDVLQQAADEASGALASSLPAHWKSVAQTLARWKQWLAKQPVHDALSAIYADGEVLARYAAATPAPLREAVLSHLNALLLAVLNHQGGRYTTAYQLVRALRKGGITAPQQAQADAVRLLTIHGAKGLEARCVLLLDTDGEAPKPESMGVLVQWPGQAPYPERFVFVVSESRPSACVKDLLAYEQAARKREELNTLYVALTRAQHTLVISSMEPHRSQPDSPWQRLQGLMEPIAAAQLTTASAAPTPALALGQAPSPPEATYAMKVLPNVPLAPVVYAQEAMKNIANEEVPAMEDATPEARVGLAMHRLLEWVRVLPAGVTDWAWTATQCEQVAQQWALDAQALQTALASAHAVLHGQGAWAWQAEQLAWYGNEVTITVQGRMLRIDRLVQHRATGQWWVLDYKSSAQPLLQADLCAQLATYRAAVALACAGQTVRAAFLTPQGRLFELPNDAL
jgi:ATP-dependent helicase/nuclease subunit A